SQIRKSNSAPRWAATLRTASPTWRAPRYVGMATVRSGGVKGRPAEVVGTGRSQFIRRPSRNASEGRNRPPLGSVQAATLRQPSDALGSELRETDVPSPKGMPPLTPRIGSRIFLVSLPFGAVALIAIRPSLQARPLPSPSPAGYAQMGGVGRDDEEVGPA